MVFANPCSHAEIRPQTPAVSEAPLAKTGAKTDSQIGCQNSQWVSRMQNLEVLLMLGEILCSESLLAGLFLRCLVDRIVYFQTHKNLISMRLAVNHFSRERGVAPFHFCRGTDVQFLVQYQTEAVNRNIGQPSPGRVFRKIAAGYVCCQVCFKPRSTSSVHSR